MSLHDFARPFVAMFLASAACQLGSVGDLTMPETRSDDAADARGTDASARGAAAPDAAATGDDTSSRAVPESGAEAGSVDAAPPPGVRSLSTNTADFGYGGASKCAGSGALFCEDFESGAIRSGVWETVGGVTVDGVRPARGAKALHMTAHSAAASFLRGKTIFPVAKNSYWGRLFVYFVSAPKPPSGYAHWNIVGASGPAVFSEIYVGGQFYNDEDKWGVGTYTADDPNGTGDWLFWDDDPNGAAKQVPEGQWMCIEWMHKGETNETRFFWDAVEHPSLYTTATHHGGNQANDYVLPQFDDIWIGWWQTHDTGQDYELFIDEIVLDTERVGCVL